MFRETKHPPSIPLHQVACRLGLMQIPTAVLLKRFGVLIFSYKGTRRVAIADIERVIAILRSRQAISAPGVEAVPA